MLILLCVIDFLVINDRFMVEMFGVGMWIVDLFSLLFSFGRILFSVLVVLVDVGIMVIVVVCVWYRFL